MSFEQAASALSEASSAPEPGQVPAQETQTPASPTPPAPSEVAPTSNQQAPAAPEAEDSFSNIDPNSLPEELKAQYRNMQADYVRKTQALADQRKQFESIGDVDRASQAVEFLNALETDPQFVVSVHQQLSAALQEAGLTPAQANAQAAAEIQGQVGGQEQAYDEYGNPVAPDPLAAEVAELKAFKQEYEQHQAEIQMASQLQSAEMAIRQQNPTWSDDDMGAVFELAFAHGGNLVAAADAYKSLQDRLLTNYIQTKGEAAGAAPPVIAGGAGNAAPVEGFGQDLDAAHKAASAHLANILAGQQ